MSSKRLYFLFVGIIVLLGIGILGGAYGINSMLEKQAHTLAALKGKGQSLSDQESKLAKDKKDIQKYASLEDIAKSVVPQDKNQALAERQIVSIANANHINLGLITFPNSDLNQLGSVTKSVSPSKLGLSQLAPVKGIPGVYDLQITVTSDTHSPVTYDQFINFLTQLEHNRRTAQVSSIALNPSEADPSRLTFTLVVNEYIKP